MRAGTLLLAIAAFCMIGLSAADFVCISPIYCDGPYLTKMQLLRIDNDSKSFVDRPLKAPVSDLLRAFEALPSNSSDEAYHAFMEQWMHPPGYEVYAVTPTDWVARPPFVEQLTSHLQPFALSLHSKWKSLVRTFNYTGLCDQCYSSIPVPHPFVVAGGRFREFYYWDSYWMLQGLLVSNMTTTARHLVDNLLYMVDKYGFVPNGGRIYYLTRSQPPMLALMVKMLFEHTGDVEWLKTTLNTLDKEQTWWKRNRSAMVRGMNGGLYEAQHYSAETAVPRPESYREDYDTAAKLPRKDRPMCYKDLAAGAETGWDFSSRWLADFSRLGSIRTTSVMPVDLASILFQAEVSLTQLYAFVGNTTMAEHYKNRAVQRARTLHKVFWNPWAMNWSDVVLSADTVGSAFYVSNLMPIWAKANHQPPEEAFQIIKRLWPKIFYPGGVPTSLITSGQQWDFPNAWAPLQQFIIEALDNLKLPEATHYADKLAVTWFNSNYCAWQSTLSEGGLFFEKYDVTHPGVAGGGGEYEVQSGFGWTNGVLLKLLQTRAHLFSIPTCSSY